jgi:L-serine dehydratase
VVLADQAERDGVSEESLIATMREALKVMRESAAAGLSPDVKSMSGMTGGQAAKLIERVRSGAECGGRADGRGDGGGAGRGRAQRGDGPHRGRADGGGLRHPAGGAAHLRKARGASDEALVMALFTAAGVGGVIAARASISGAQAGCQAECGSASAMAAAALVELSGGAAGAAQRVSLALMNVMGLVCDPVGGLVEVPCVYRNVLGVVNAVAAADMALSGIQSILPADEVIDAMGRVGRSMPASLRETGEGGCAACPSARRGR